MEIVLYQPFHGRRYIKTPTYIPSRTLINVKNNDNRCFEWAILSTLFPKQHGQLPDRPVSYQTHLGKLNFTGISSPVTVTNIIKFERQNQGLSVNVFGWNAGIYPLHVSKQKGPAIDLLLLTDRHDPVKTHCVWIKELTRMVRQNSKHNVRKYPCRRCLHDFSSEALLKNTKNECQGIGEKPQRTEMPKEGQNILKFTNHHKQMRVPYIIYTDFEALNIPQKAVQANQKKNYAQQITNRVPCSYCYVMARSDSVANDFDLCRREKAVEHFLLSLQAELKDILRKPVDMIVTGTDQKAFYEAADCHICGKALVNDRDCPRPLSHY